MSPLNVATIQGNRFYYICGRDLAKIIRSDKIIQFNLGKLSLEEAADRWNIVVEDIKDFYIHYRGVDTYLEKEWGLTANCPAILDSYDGSMYTLEPVNDG